MHRDDENGAKMPQVSIGLPVYNGGKYLRQALNSLLAQTFTDFELIISDDASTDGTSDLCTEYALKDQRIRYIRQTQTLGMAGNQNFVLQKARGAFFMWGAQDDLWDHQFVRTLYDALASNDRYTSAFCPFVFTDESLQKISGVNFFNLSSRFTFIRLLKLCIDYNDAFFYGLHRRKAMENVRIPTWWSVNSRVPVNNNYPVLFYLISAGEYILAGSTPLWFNRIKTPDYQTNPYPQSALLLRYLAFLLRKINVFCVSVLFIFKARKSIVIVLAILPVLIARLFWDCISATLHHIVGSKYPLI